MFFLGRMPRISYLLRLCVVAMFYAFGGLLVQLGMPKEGTSLVSLLCMFFGSGCVLLALLLWRFASVRRFHDVNLSGWWFLLALLFPPVITLGLCLWPGTPDYNRFGAPSR